MKTITLSTSVVWRGIAPERRLHYGEKILSLGSCFSERIGSWLFRHGFDAMVNPFGTLYNPISIAQALEYLAEGACSFDPSTLLFEHQASITALCTTVATPAPLGRRHGKASKKTSRGENNSSVRGDGCS
ncbi:GSCFA domain-containing protein [Porphyromonas gingivicanis]|uniref:GSCFA domain-containing protein n=1 Tax=Porphyromonas gingivicanis TaxID=266762 RepID=UPI000687BFD4|nr:GSCFA domain-containing protein [Porphyromonas gingivicanis]